LKEAAPRLRFRLFPAINRWGHPCFGQPRGPWSCSPAIPWSLRHVVFCLCNASVTPLLRLCNDLTVQNLSVLPRVLRRNGSQRGYPHPPPPRLPVARLGGQEEAWCQSMIMYTPPGLRHPSQREIGANHKAATAAPAVTLSPLCPSAMPPRADSVTACQPLPRHLLPPPLRSKGGVRPNAAWR